MDSQVGTSSNTATALSQWEGDWFVFNNGVIQGPLSAIQAFSMENLDSQGKPLLISKKGFTQWYALRELADIFRVTEDLGKRVENEKTAFTQQQMISNAIESQKQIAKPSQQEKTSGSFSSKIVKKQVGPKSHNIVDIRQQAQSALSVEEPKNSEISFPLKDAPAQRVPVVSPKEGMTPVAKAGKEAAKSAKLSKTIQNQSPVAVKVSPKRSKKQLLQEYFLIRSRLRLGKIRSPWATAFFGLPLSLGLMWPLWMASLLKEVFYHSASRTNFPKSVVIMSMIPGLHFYGVFRLAQLVREMEMQNRYKSVSPLLAAVFSVFPPFAMAYLQDAANRHWLLHARHVGTQKNPR